MLTIRSISLRLLVEKIQSSLLSTIVNSSGDNLYTLRIYDCPKCLIRAVGGSLVTFLRRERDCHDLYFYSDLHLSQINACHRRFLGSSLFNFSISMYILLVYFHHYIIVIPHREYIHSLRYSSNWAISKTKIHEKLQLMTITYLLPIYA